MEFADIVIKVMNFFHLLFKPRKTSNFRWANSVRDAINFDEFADHQFTKIYGRVSSRYNYHPLQRYENFIRQFDLTETMAASMKQYGNITFYQTICHLSNLDRQRNYACDFTKIDDLPTITSAADYLYQQVYHRKRGQNKDANAERSAREAAEIARTNYIRGFTRTVNAADYGDWERLRNELRRREHTTKMVVDAPEDGITLVALSYKGKDVRITRRMQLVGEDGSPVRDSGIVVQTTAEMTSDFLDDFRWSQLVRSCMEIAKRRNTGKVRVWIDRLVMMGYETDEVSRRYKFVDWEEFGLFPYAVCPVVRLYDANEKYSGTDFWRKLEAVLGVAGKGLVVDDYMLRKFDETILFGHEMYQRYENGLSQIGGTGVYVRATTLALATAILTDGVTTSSVNEDIRTKKAVGRWKAWALRTIGEGAYSAQHFCMLAQEDPFRVGMDKFLTIAFWESFVSRAEAFLTGNSYLDMSIQRSTTWRKSSCWDGVLEWIGMVESSCEIVDREAILQFIKDKVEMEMWTSTTGHVAAWMTLYGEYRIYKRSIVVDLSRYSTGTHGHVTAVAEATGLWKAPFLPFYLKHIPLPDQDQKAKITDDGIIYMYQPMKIVFAAVRTTYLLLVHFLLLGVAIWLSVDAESWKPAVIVIGILLVVDALLLLVFFWPSWPWHDRTDVGEALFDNLLLHSLYGSGIKKQYRKLKPIRYDEIGWTGVEAEEKLLRENIRIDNE